MKLSRPRLGSTLGPPPPSALTLWLMAASCICTMLVVIPLSAVFKPVVEFYFDPVDTRLFSRPAGASVLFMYYLRAPFVFFDFDSDLAYALGS